MKMLGRWVRTGGSTGGVPPLTLCLPRDATQSAVLPWHVARLSGCETVTLKYCGYIVWVSSKTIIHVGLIIRYVTLKVIKELQIVRLGFSLSEAPKFANLVQREHPQILGEVGCGEWVFRAEKPQKQKGQDKANVTIVFDVKSYVELSLISAKVYVYDLE